MKKYVILIMMILVMLPSAIGVAQDADGIETEFLFDIQIDLPNAPHDVGNTPYGGRSIYPIIGGTVEGPMIKGEILNGADYGLGRSDDAFELNVHLVIRTDDDALIYMTYAGIVYFPEDATVIGELSHSLKPVPNNMRG